MNRLSRFLALLFGDAVVSVLAVVLPIAIAMFILIGGGWLIGNALLYWFHFDLPVTKSNDPEWMSVAAFGVAVMVYGCVVAFFGWAIIELVRWLHDKWVESGQPPAES